MDHQPDNGWPVMSNTMDYAEKMLSGWRDFKNGKSKLRTWTIDPATGRRTRKYRGIEEVRGERARELKAIRTGELRMTRKQLARPIHVSTRTLQGWERGRSLPPEPIMVLVRLMKDMPEVRSRLAA